jgi:hypothetical protein
MRNTAVYPNRWRSNLQYRRGLWNLGRLVVELAGSLSRHRQQSESSDCRGQPGIWNRKRSGRSWSDGDGSNSIGGVCALLAVFARYISRQAAGCNNATASASLDLPTTNAPTPTCHGTTYTWGTLDFDHATARKASFSFRLPLGWTGNIDVGLDWFTSAITNTNKWTIESACLVEGTTDATAPSFNTAQTITTTSNGTTNVLTRSAQAAITTTGCTAGNIIILRVGRDVTDTNTSTDSLRNIDVTLRVTPQA